MFTTKMCSLQRPITVTLAAALFIIVLSLDRTEAAVFTQPAAIHPAHPGKCFDKITRRAMLPDKEYKPKGICAVMTCDIASLTINIETCPYVEMPGCEELVADSRWSFPKCCPQYKCTDFKTGKEFIVSA